MVDGIGNGNEQKNDDIKPKQTESGVWVCEMRLNATKTKHSMRSEREKIDLMLLDQFGDDHVPLCEYEPRRVSVNVEVNV